MSFDVEIHFLGCFDKVSSTSAHNPRSSKFESNAHVYRHAVALDEYRPKFKLDTWHPKCDDIKEVTSL